ncbi:MAG: PilZ domain-containing protein [Pseudomonadota bacterium]
MKIILLIEARQNVCQALTTILQSQVDSFQIITADNFDKAIELIGRIKFDAIIVGDTIRSSELDMLDSLLIQHRDTKLIIMSDKDSKFSDIIKTFEYKTDMDVPLQVGNLLDILLKELGVDYGGQLRGVSLASFLQMIELEAVTCTLTITAGNKDGILYCDTGNLIAATTADKTGHDAAVEILSWLSPLIKVDYDQHAHPQNLRVPLMSLLLECTRIDDENESKLREKRRYRRFKCNLPAELEVDSLSYEGVIRNISLGGGFVETGAAFEAGQTICLTLVSLSTYKSSAFVGKIILTNPDGVYVEFETISLKQKQIIRTIMEENKDLPSEKVKTISEFMPE